MAIKASDESAYHTTTDLILPKPLKFYCAPMHSGHWQLRSLISSPRPDILFYPHGRDIVVLNTKTRERYILTTLKFEPRCLTSTNEWLCCGGDKGDYTAIYFGHDLRSISCHSQDIDLYARLPFDLDPFWRSAPAQRPNKDIRPITEVTKLVGIDIVNCITIWTPSDISSECAYKEPVALVSNNDRSITILKLESAEILEKLTLPDCVNRSLMSPEGDMLISICDDPFLYIHKRKLINKYGDELRFSKKSKYNWHFEGRVQLEGQVRTNPPESRGSFAAAFSPSAKYLAVATQHGLISIFEKNNIFAPPVSVFTSSRMTSNGDGYVRDMEFCPGPFDLLAWTESKDRIVIADVRNFFLSRQILLLDPNQIEDVEKISINDRAVNSSVDSSRLRDEPTFRVITDYSSLNSESSGRRPIRTLSRDELNRRAQLRILDQPLSIQRRDGSTTRMETSTTPTWRSSIEVRRPISISYTTSSLRSGRPSNAGLPTTLREFLTQDRAPSFRSFINDRNRVHERRSQQDHEQDLEPRRRTIAQNLASSLNTAESFTDREVPRNESENNVNLERLSLSNAQRRDLESDSLWSGSSLSQLRNSSHPQSSDRTSRLRIELEEDDRGEIETRMDELIDFALDAQRVITGQRISPQNGIVTTMGCCWSQDGKIIYAATESGIHEFHVNIKGRKLFPRLTLC
ncbi:putative wd domain containing protein [Erysiphe necator]|uniref:Putative wd domain containing protein n=1 Tax=Uncinula necator TaxID=52586 RepID=A0A0B1P0L4_UNCNE|nr:putative wd domain containing protein [Erysiphe necator]